MIARASQLFLPTLRDAPADAEAASHKLLVRGGFLRQMGAGLWSFMPLGWRVHQRIEQIIREEINAIGGEEMGCPTLTPAGLWGTTGRIRGPSLVHLRDQGPGRAPAAWRPVAASRVHHEGLVHVRRRRGRARRCFRPPRAG